jgi:hypothetical protein
MRHEEFLGPAAVVPATACGVTAKARRAAVPMFSTHASCLVPLPSELLGGAAVDRDHLAVDEA